MSGVSVFRDLHKGSAPLLLPNAWDAGSARLVEALGAKAVATTSAGFAWALGYADGRALPFREVVASARRIVRVLNVPLSVDIENGYSDDPSTVASNVMQLIDLGVSGINIEDGQDAPLLLALKIEAIRQALSKVGADLFINARSDVYLANLGEASQRAADSIARANLYANAGADGIFLPAIVQGSDIKQVASSVPLPLNVMAVPGLPVANELGAWGVRRLSAGSGISQVVLGKAKALASTFLKDGRSEIFDEALPYSEIQELFINLEDKE